MAASLGTLTLDLVARIGQFVQPIRDAEGQARQSMSAIEQHADGAANSIKGMIASGAGLLSLGALFGKYIQNTRDAEQEQAQLAAVLKSTGQAAGYSQNQLNDMADSMSQLSVLSGGEINQAQTSLLAFTGIVGKEFPRALQAAIDMSARTGMSVVSAAETIGRALDVPSKGLTALSKQGFRFTDDQKALAEQLERTGRSAEAQGIILDSLEDSYEGAAAATRNTFNGALAGLNNTFDDLLTGDGSLQIATNLINNLSEALGSDEAAQGLQVLTVGVVGFATVVGGRLVASTTASAVSFINAQREAARYTAALAAMAGMSTRAAASQAALGAATRGASALMGVLGGPVGLIATVGLSAAAYLLLRDNAADANAALETSAKYAGLTAEQFRQLSAAQKDVTKDELKESFNAQGAELDRLSARYAALTDELILYAKQQGLGSKYSSEFIEIQKGVRGGTIAYADALERLNAMDFLTLEQKKQALDAINAYNAQYAAVMQTGSSLETVGLKYNVAGSAAQNAAIGIKASGDAAAAAAGQVDGLSSAMQDYIDKTKQGIFSNTMQLNLRQKGFSPEQAQALSEARVAKGGNLSAQDANLALAGVKSNEALARSNDAIKDSTKAVAKEESALTKARKKAADDALRANEQRLNEYKQVVESLDDESTRVNKVYSEQKRLIEEFASSADVAKQVQQAHDAAKQKLTEIGVAQAREYNKYFEFESDKAESIEAQYEQEKLLAVNNTTFTIAEREKIFDALERQKQQELALIKLSDAQSLLYAKQGYLSQKDYMVEYYALEREQIRLTKDKSDEWRAAQEQAIEMQQFQARQAMESAAFGTFSSAFQIDDEAQRQNQYDAELAQQAELLNQQLVTYEEYLQAKAEITKRYNDAESSLRLSQAGNIAGSFASMFKDIQGEQSTAYRVMFAAQKGFAIAQSVMAIQAAMASSAMSLPFPANLGAMATVAAQMASIVSTISSVTPQGFANGGYTGAGGKYEPAGIVHKGEVVWSQADIKRAGGVSNVEALRKGGNSESEVATQAPVNLNPNFVIVDERANLADYLFSPDGTKAFVKFFKRNRSALGV